MPGGLIQVRRFNEQSIYALWCVSQITTVHAQTGHAQTGHAHDCGL